MTDIERILLECRYMLSLNKTYLEIANYLNIGEDVVYRDLNYLLPRVDSILYERILKKLKKAS